MKDRARRLDKAEAVALFLAGMVLGAAVVELVQNLRIVKEWR